jgi:hypothetical protein
MFGPTTTESPPRLSASSTRRSPFFVTTTGLVKVIPTSRGGSLIRPCSQRREGYVYSFFSFFMVANDPVAFHGKLTAADISVVTFMDHVRDLD